MAGKHCQAGTAVEREFCRQKKLNKFSERRLHSHIWDNKNSSDFLFLICAFTEKNNLLKAKTIRSLFKEMRMHFMHLTSYLYSKE